MSSRILNKLLLACFLAGSWTFSISPVEAAPPLKKFQIDEAKIISLKKRKGKLISIGVKSGKKKYRVVTCFEKKCKRDLKTSIVPNVDSVVIGSVLQIEGRRLSGSYMVTKALVLGANIPLPPENLIPTLPAPTPNPPVLTPTPEAGVQAIQLPIEVVGEDGTSVTKEIALASEEALAGQKLYLRIHGLTYADKIGVSINQGTEITLRNETVEVETAALRHGGIGGGFTTIKVYVPLAPQLLKVGKNTFTFRFLFSDGISSGFRVIEFNILDASGKTLINDGRLFQEDPQQWKPQLTSAADIAAGKALWRNAPLIERMTGKAIKARCQDCHFESGSDLKYFNFSDASIVARSTFHGLTAHQGQQIASYIRSIDSIAPGRPWNPPYQPGPGIDSKPVSEWAAGAGIDAVLNTDEEMLDYIFPKGITVDHVRPELNLSAREMPVSFQFPDWNSWLPTVHPIDGFGSASMAGILADDCATTTDLLKRSGQCAVELIRTKLNSILPRRAITLDDLHDSTFQAMPMYTGRAAEEVNPIPTSDENWTIMDVHRAFSLRQWIMVRQFGLHREFNLEGTLATPEYPQLRRWVGGSAFMTSPVMVGLPKKNFYLRNGDPAYHEYLGFVWYQIQLVLNDGNRKQGANSPIDWGYSFAHLKDLSNYSNQGGMGLLTLWFVKGLQLKNSNTPIKGASKFGLRSGFSAFTSPAFMKIQYNVDEATHTKVVDALFRALIDELASYPNSDYFGVGSDGSIALPLAPGEDDGKLASDLWQAIPIARTWGVSNDTITKMINFGKRMFPAPVGYTWDDLRTVACKPGSSSNLPGSRYYIKCDSERVFLN